MILEELTLMQTLLEVQGRWLRSDRGEREGKYLLMEILYGCTQHHAVGSNCPRIVTGGSIRCQ
jgi:hypothetical protein